MPVIFSQKALLSFFIYPTMQEGLFSYEKNKKNFASIMKKGKYCKKSSPDGVCNPVRNISGSNVFLWFPIMNRR
ncbi:MAG: hypothetical protein DRI57_13370 [Deltaproteobacteria bacterium]|nr:MAG: hypothetical protein DRI57_13370 [Deltaproteobacteria bacterium]